MRKFLFIMFTFISFLQPTAYADENETPYSELVDVLMQYGKNPAKPPVIASMEAKDIDALKLMIEWGADVNAISPVKSYSGSCLPAISQGRSSPPITSYSLSDGEYSLLEMALIHGNTNIIDYLLKKGANPYYFRRVSFYFTNIEAKNDQPRVNGKLIHLVSHQSTIVYEAIRLNRLDVVKILVENFFDINATCLINGRMELSPLTVAVSFSRNDIVEFLLKNGAKI